MNLIEKLNHALAIAQAEHHGHTIQYQESVIRPWWDLEPKKTHNASIEENLREVLSNPERFRIKPKPVTRPWSKPEDVPGPVCWITVPMFQVMMVVALQRSGVIFMSDSGKISKTWDEVAAGGYVHSTDRKTWLPCMVTEEQP